MTAEWMPTGPEPEAVPAGRWWDAVRAPLVHAWTVPARLVEYAPAIVTRRPATLTWLVPCGSVEPGALPPGVELLTGGAELEIPPERAVRTVFRAPPPLHWTLPPGRGQQCAVIDPPDALMAALRTAIPTDRREARRRGC